MRLPNTGRGAVLPPSAFDEYRRCLADVGAGASSCALTETVSMLGGRHEGWLADVRTRGRRHLFRLIDPTNRRVVRIGAIPVTFGCAELGESRHTFSRRRRYPSDFAVLESVRTTDDGAAIVLTIAEQFPLCDGWDGCDCSCMGSRLVHQRVLELRVPPA